jgi:DNA-binding transcriptional LysR family regulator
MSLGRPELPITQSQDSTNCFLGNPFRVSTPIVALQAALAGSGIALLPAYEVGPDHRLERILPTPCLSTSMWIVFHE